jgi:hypothetical protein
VIVLQQQDKRESESGVATRERQQIGAHLSSTREQQRTQHTNSTSPYRLHQAFQAAIICIIGLCVSCHGLFVSSTAISSSSLVWSARRVWQGRHACCIGWLLSGFLVVSTPLVLHWFFHSKGFSEVVFFFRPTLRSPREQFSVGKRTMDTDLSLHTKFQIVAHFFLFESHRPCACSFFEKPPLENLLPVHRASALQRQLSAHSSRRSRTARHTAARLALQQQT